MEDEYGGYGDYYGPGMHYDPMFALRGELVSSCMDGVMWGAMFDGYNGPARMGMSWHDFAKKVCDHEFMDSGATLYVGCSLVRKHALAAGC